MLRPEYEKLVRLFKDSGKYRLVNRKKDRNFKYVFGRLTDRRTIIANSKNTASAGYGLFLDVCVVDGLPKNKVRRFLHIWLMVLLSKCRAVTVRENEENKDSFFLKKWTRKAIRRFTTTGFWNDRMEALMDRYPVDTSEYVGNFTSSYGRRELLHAKAFSGYFDIEFEGWHFMACNGYKEYLENIYGDYMKLPPIEKRKRTHLFDAYWI